MSVLVGGYVLPTMSRNPVLFPRRAITTMNTPYSDDVRQSSDNAVFVPKVEATTASDLFDEVKAGKLKLPDALQVLGLDVESPAATELIDRYAKEQEGLELSDLASLANQVCARKGLA